MRWVKKSSLRVEGRGMGRLPSAVFVVAAVLVAGCSSSAADEATGVDTSPDDLVSESVGYCAGYTVGSASAVVMEPSLGQPKERADDDGESVSLSVEVLESAGDLRQRTPASPLADFSTRPLDRISVPESFERAASGSMSNGQYRVALLGLRLEVIGLFEVADDRLRFWGVCQDDWTDETEIFVDWTGRRDLDEVVRQIVANAAADPTEDVIQAAAGLWDLGMGVSEPLGWDERDSSARSFVDADVPEKIRNQLKTILVYIEHVEPVDDADVVICPVQRTATTGYCFGVDALATATEGSVLELAVLPDEDLVFELGRESLWAQRGHAIGVAASPVGAERFDLELRPTKQVSGLPTARVAAGVEVVVTQLRDADDLPQPTQYLGGAEPYEGA